MTTVALNSTYWSDLGHGIGAIFCYALLGLALMVVGFYALDLTTPGHLRTLVGTGKPNAVALSATGFLSLAAIVVMAIYSSSGKLEEGLISAAVYGLVAIVAQVIAVRLIEALLGIDMDALLTADSYDVKVLVTAAAHLGLGLVVATAIL
ncbi:MAG: DUF350 domain-containing protein [Mycobacteriaceae bacterium]|nr:DUF350 domain-containing protein [Mycobacteriaceae bacterium]